MNMAEMPNPLSLDPAYKYFGGSMSKKSLDRPTRIRELVSQLCVGLHERNDEMTVALLAVLAGQNVN